MATITSEEVGALLIIAAYYADDIMTQGGTADKVKAVALKAKSIVTMMPNDDGNIDIQTGPYRVVR